MRTAFATCLLTLILASGAAAARPSDHDRSDRDKPTPAESPRPVSTPAVMPPPDGHGQFPGAAVRPGRDGKDNRGRHDRHPGGGGWGFYPYPPVPMTWPYPAYPYSQYYYPYPPQYYPNNIYGDDDYPPVSTRGLVVPGDLPVGQTAFWYYCDTPDGYYPYVKECSHEWTRIPVSPPPPGTAAPLSYSDWQWCEEKKAFFPYVTSCTAGFVPVPVTVPGKDQAGPPQTANWYFCSDPKGYSPYVVQCARDWRAVPAVPPPSVKITVKGEKK